VHRSRHRCAGEAAATPRAIVPGATSTTAFALSSWILLAASHVSPPPKKSVPSLSSKKNSYAAPKQKCIMRLSKLFERNQARGRGLLHLHGRPTPRAWLDTMGDVLKAFEDKKLDFDNWLKTQPPAVRAPATTPPRVSSLARNNCHVCGSKGEWRHISTGSVCCAIGRRHTNHLPTRPLPSFRRLKSASPPPQMRSKVCAARIRPRVCFRDRSEK
jgi:hypothetical protein